MRRLRPITLSLTLVVLLAACGSSSTGGAATTEASVDSAPSQQIDTPAAGGGGGGGAIPTIADGPWKGGKLHLDMSGGKSLGIDADLAAPISITSDGSTALIYSSGDGADMTVITVGIDPASGPAVSVNGGGMIVAGGTEEGCQFAFPRNDGSGLDGTFACSNLDELSSAGLNEGSINLNGNFSADR